MVFCALTPDLRLNIDDSFWVFHRLSTDIIIKVLKLYANIIFLKRRAHTIIKYQALVSTI